MNNYSGANHFTIPSKKSSIAPAPDVFVINLNTLDQALHPDGRGINGNNNGLDSRVSTPGAVGLREREPLELHFLTDLETISISQNFVEEYCNCPWKTVMDFKAGGGKVLMKAFKQVSFISKENVEIFNAQTNELSILIECLDAGCITEKSVQVYGPPGKSLGIVEAEGCCCCQELFNIKNNNGDTLYTATIETSCFGQSVYQIFRTSDNVLVADIIIAMCSWTLKLTFKEDIPPSRKAMIIGFAILLDRVESQKRKMKGVFLWIMTSYPISFYLTILERSKRKEKELKEP